MIENIKYKSKNSNDNNNINASNLFKDENIIIHTSHCSTHTPEKLNRNKLKNMTELSNILPKKIGENYRSKNYIQEQTNKIQNFKQSGKKKIVENIISNNKYLEENKNQDTTKFNTTEIKYDKDQKNKLKKKIKK